MSDKYNQYVLKRVSDFLNKNNDVELVLTQEAEITGETEDGFVKRKATGMKALIIRSVPKGAL